MRADDIYARLAANPHYKMSKRQVAELRRRQEASTPVQHDTEPPIHPTGFEQHPTELPKQDSHGQL